MRVVHVVPTMFGRAGLFGGGERHPLELARALAPHVACRLVSFGPRAGRTREAGGLELEVIEPIAMYRSHPAHPLSLELVGATRGADVVHTHHMRSAPSRIAAVAARIRGQRTVVTDHGLGGGGWGGLLPRLFDSFACVSRYSADTLGAPEKKTHVIYGGADTARFHPEPAEDRAGVLYVGRLTPHKGVDVLIRALPPGSALTIAGTEGHDRAEPERSYPDLLHSLAEHRNVSFMGPAEETGLPGLHRRSRVFVLPSVNRTCYGRWVAIPELLGLGILEAMASGTPVVASRVGGVPEIVADGETGYLVEPGNVEELRDRISELLNDPRRARLMGEAGRDLVLARFTWDHCARRCLEAYGAPS